MASRDLRNLDDDSEPEFDPLNPDVREDEDWEDAEPEEAEQYQFVSLFDGSVFPSLQEMVEHDRKDHSFDLLAHSKDMKLDFIGTVRLVNYIRSEVQKGNLKPEVTSQEAFADETYLRPVLDDDAVLINLGDLKLEDGDESFDLAAEEDAGSRIQQLEEELRRAHSIIEELRRISQRNFEDGSDDLKTSPSVQVDRKESATIENDKSYFRSYDHNDIHSVMLQDTVRTDAYRDFIYDNKELFAGKVVLDVGCGTGILSMMCAKAGAAKVFAVDNSDIIDKARANVFENDLSDVVNCLRGKIEEVDLPVRQVDVIVSEWMGYALLYESMLDSVIFARDKYLKAGGLMVPSHATLFMAPISVPDVITERVDFWRDVYGFRMPAMTEGIFDEVSLRNLADRDVAGTPKSFLQLSLHTTKVQDTKFSAQPFTTKITKAADSVDGFAVWFDMFFARSPDVQIPADTQARDWKDGTAFTTGPGPTSTHWQQVLLLFNRLKDAESIHTGEQAEMTGTIGYERREENDRQLDITVSWSSTSTEKKFQQKWELA